MLVIAYISWNIGQTKKKCYHIINMKWKRQQILKNDTKNGTYYYFDNMIHINDFNHKNIKVDKKKSYKDVLIY